MYSGKVPVAAYNIMKMDTDLRFVESLPDRHRFYDLFLTTGWNKNYRLNADKLHEALLNSWYVICVYDKERLVGFGRIICDGVVHALILDMIVHPDYQRKGIGSRILDLMVERCQRHRIRDIQLFCAKDKVGFYSKHGFKPRPENAPGMEIKMIYEPRKG